MSASHILSAILEDASLGAARQPFGASAVIFEPQTPAEWIFLIESGQVRILHLGSATARLAGILGAGDWFGSGGLGGREQYGSRALAVTPVVTWKIATAILRDRIVRLPPPEANLMLYLAKRAQAAEEEASRLVFDDCHQRLLKTLIDFSQTVAATPTEHGVILRMTHEQLAQAVGAARETVSLALTQLRQQNLLRTGRNSMSFDPQDLRNLARENQRKAEASAPTAPADESAAHPIVATPPS